MKKSNRIIAVILVFVLLITSTTCVQFTTYAASKPSATSIAKIEAKPCGFKVTWKKQTKNTTGYQVQYATDSKFKNNKKTVTISKKGTTSKTISKLKAKKKYYVRIRTYKAKNNKKSYSSWSKSKTVTTKKNSNVNSRGDKVYQLDEANPFYDSNKTYYIDKNGEVYYEDKEGIHFIDLDCVNYDKVEKQYVNTRIQQIINDCNISSDMPDFLKIAILGKWFYYNVTYDYEMRDYIEGKGPEPKQKHYNGQTTYEALYYRKAVCAGISRCFRDLLNAVNVNCVYTTGMMGDQSHARVFVQINGYWYEFDPQNCACFLCNQIINDVSISYLPNFVYTCVAPLKTTSSYNDWNKYLPHGTEETKNLLYNDAYNSYYFIIRDWYIPQYYVGKQGFKI